MAWAWRSETWEQFVAVSPVHAQLFPAGLRAHVLSLYKDLGYLKPQMGCLVIQSTPLFKTARSREDQQISISSQPQAELTIRGPSWGAPDITVSSEYSPGPLLQGHRPSEQVRELGVHPRGGGVRSWEGESWGTLQDSPSREGASESIPSYFSHSVFCLCLLFRVVAILVRVISLISQLGCDLFQERDLLYPSEEMCILKCTDAFFPCQGLPELP